MQRAPAEPAQEVARALALDRELEPAPAPESPSSTDSKCFCTCPLNGGLTTSGVVEWAGQDQRHVLVLTLAKSLTRTIRSVSEC